MAGERLNSSSPYLDLFKLLYVLDPDRLIRCPYNKHHLIRVCRFSCHIVKCRKNYPELAKELVTCPFHARHLVRQADLSDHITKCRYKEFIEQDIVNQSSDFEREQMNAVSTWQAPPCDEDWEAESLEQPSSPFIWGMSSSGTNSTSFEHKNCLPSRVRAPESFPYACHGKADYMVSRGPAVEHLLDTSETPWLSTRRRRKLPLQKAVVVTSVAGERVSEGPLTAWRA
ncbi:gametocyte-specific factor 1-like [Opisthocomus hoazin]|uniref:gametocyte-specific factor 1-like n=1 Tax=Opisthocomus hoazin TaxID=30419 RepID=UPI003F53BF13